MKLVPLEGGGFIRHHGPLGPTLYDENGRRDVLICHRPFASQHIKRTETPEYEVRPSGNCGQEILDTSGTIVCWTTDEVMAAHIAKLLNLYKKVKG
ncbi:MAG: hypothetical protein AB7I37_17710 [Pirellulales bacterium]